MIAYGLDPKDARLCEGDHDLPIELGGCPGPGVGCDFELNYWPEIWDGPLGAHVKDQVEDAAHRLVCAGKIPLVDAQRKIATDWVGFYNELKAQGEIR
jgi:hypothetical protein